MDLEIWKLGISNIGCLLRYASSWHTILGGTVEAATVREYGKAILSIVHHEYLFAGLEPTMPSWMSHGDSVTKLPDGFEIIGVQWQLPWPP